MLIRREHVDVGADRPGGGGALASRQPRAIRPGMTLRVLGTAPFVLHWTANEWQEAHDTAARDSELGVHYVDLPTSSGQQAPLRFTFLWTASGKWEGRDYAVAVEPAG